MKKNMSLATAFKTNIALLQTCMVLYCLDFHSRLTLFSQNSNIWARAGHQTRIYQQIFNSFIPFIFLPRQRILLWRDEIPEKKQIVIEQAYDATGKLGCEDAKIIEMLKYFDTL